MSTNYLLQDYIKNLEIRLLEALWDKQSNIPYSQVFSKLKNIHLGYSQIRDNFFSLISDNLSAKSYASYYGLINSFKTKHLLNLLDPNFAPNSALDFGSGPGSCSWAILDSYPSIKSLTCIEHNPFMIDVLKESISNLFPTVSLDTLLDVDKLDEKNFDIIFLGNSLNELSIENQYKLLTTLFNQLNENGYLIILEPGSRDITRNLMLIRDSLVKDSSLNKNFSIEYPCYHSNKCLLLNDNSQWCHSDLFFERTEHFRLIDNALSLNKHTVSFSALILKKTDTKIKSDKFRIITEPQITKAGATSYICGEDYQGQVMLQKRDKNDLNRGFFKAKMHDLTTWEDKFKKIS